MEHHRFAYERISFAELRSSDLQKEAKALPDAQAYLVHLIKQDGYHQKAEGPEALYSHALGRMGIAWGADATWADVEDVEDGISLYLNDGETWNARN
jgi:hypothetical protein